MEPAKVQGRLRSRGQPHCDEPRSDELQEPALHRLRQHLVDAGKEHLLPATRAPGWEARNGDWWPPGENIRICSIKKVMAFLERRYRPPSSEHAAADGEAPLPNSAVGRMFPHFRCLSIIAGCLLPWSM